LQKSDDAKSSASDIPDDVVDHRNLEDDGATYSSVAKVKRDQMGSDGKDGDRTRAAKSNLDQSDAAGLRRSVQRKKKKDRPQRYGPGGGSPSDPMVM